MLASTLILELVHLKRGNDKSTRGLQNKSPRGCSLRVMSHNFFEKIVTAVLEVKLY